MFYDVVVVAQPFLGGGVDGGAAPIIANWRLYCKPRRHTSVTLR
jgi:hypothetical protein